MLSTVGLQIHIISQRSVPIFSSFYDKIIVLSNDLTIFTLFNNKKLKGVFNMIKYRTDRFFLAGFY